jgi:radical SAM protein with 4Fe4S-binding SPASM domain
MQTLLNQLGWVPRSCVWEITRACNLRCGHCGSAAGRPRSSELSTTECLRVIDELSALGTELITLSGGEPTIRADWRSIARYAVDRGITTNLVTNGQSDSRVLAADTREAGLANVAVSLDGLEATHDTLRAPGAFHRACLTIQELTMASIWVDVMVTVNRKNLAELHELHSHVAKLGAKRFRVQLGKPLGNQTHRHDLTLAPRQLLDLMPILGRLNGQSNLPVRLGDSIGYYSSEEQRLRGDYCDQGFFTGCYAGCQAIGIQSDGSIKGCLSLQPRAGEADPFIEGNVRNETLADIWLDPGRFSYNRAPQHDLQGACGSCSHQILCRGGAKCVAYAFTGGLQHDPMCHLAVLRAHRQSTERVWPMSSAAAAAAMLFGVAANGCSGQVEPGSIGTGGTGGGTASAPTGGAPAAGGPGAGGTSAIGTSAGGTQTGGNVGSGGQSTTGGTTAKGTGTANCQSVCCMCDYGIIAPELYAACCSI